MTNTLQNTTALTPQALARETSLSYDLNKMIVGYECEVGSQRGNYISPSIIRDKLLEQGLNYVIVTTDGSANVDAEIIFLQRCQRVDVSTHGLTQLIQS